MERTRVYIKAPFPRQLRAYLVEQEATIGRMYNGTVRSVSHGNARQALDLAPSLGQVFSWGRGLRGQLGLGPGKIHRATPTIVPGPLTNVHVISLAAGRACVTLM